MTTQNIRLQLFSAEDIGAAGGGSDTIESEPIDIRFMASIDAVLLQGSASASDFKLEFAVGPSATEFNEYTDHDPLIANLAALPNSGDFTTYQPIAMAAPLASWVKFRVTNNRAASDAVSAYLAFSELLR